MTKRTRIVIASALFTGIVSLAAIATSQPQPTQKQRVFQAGPLVPNAAIDAHPAPVSVRIWVVRIPPGLDASLLNAADLPVRLSQAVDPFLAQLGSEDQVDIARATLVSAIGGVASIKTSTDRSSPRSRGFAGWDSLEVQVTPHAIKDDQILVGLEIRRVSPSLDPQATNPIEMNFQSVAALKGGVPTVVGEADLTGSESGVAGRVFIIAEAVAGS